ncbi:iron-containing alcohol dehydrogenase, partial [Salmonella enterica]|uniref:iron-containing alcohol dehydrogenase n=1 Tax=Salmonella enterica TaxID=28901 RepID=UPI00398C4C10
AVADAKGMWAIARSVTAETCRGALTQAVEADVAGGWHPIDDASRLEAIRVIQLQLRIAVEECLEIEAREQMSFGQYLAGMAFNSAGFGPVHALSHPPGPTHNLPPGSLEPILFPMVLTLTLPNALPRF